jgi:hypothetical protein
MLLPFNTSVFSNLLGASNRAAQCKALVSPFDEFDGKPEDVHQHIEQFTHCCVKTGVIEDFSFIVSEEPPPSDIDLSDPIEKAAWLVDPRHFKIGNLLIYASQATMDKIQGACDKIRTNLQKFSLPPDPVKMPLAPKHLVSFQNHRWIYVLLMTIWTPALETIMLRYQELHYSDSIVLWYCFLQHFAGTTIETLIEAYSHLSKNKLHLYLLQDKILKFTDAVHAPIQCLIKANESPSFQHFLTVIRACKEASNEEFRAFVMTLYSYYRAGGPTKIWRSLL